MASAQQALHGSPWTYWRKTLDSAFTNTMPAQSAVRIAKGQVTNHETNERVEGLDPARNWRDSSRRSEGWSKRVLNRVRRSGDWAGDLRASRNDVTDVSIDFAQPAHPEGSATAITWRHVGDRDAARPRRDKARSCASISRRWSIIPQHPLLVTEWIHDIILV